MYCIALYSSICIASLVLTRSLNRIEPSRRLVPLSGIIDVKIVFYVFYYFFENAFFNVFIFGTFFLFSSGETFYPTKPAKILLNLLDFSIKRLLSDGFNMAVIKILS